MERYFDQMFTPLLFSAHCYAAHMPFFNETVADQKIEGQVAAGLQQMRSGAFQQVGGLVQIAGAGDLDEARRRQALDLLARDAANFAVILNPAQRQQIAAMAEGLGSRFPPDARPLADKVVVGVRQAECGKLCSM
jgi:hypothetical protein